MAVTQPMAFDYEIATAIYFMLEEGYDELIVDVPRREDSFFYKGQSVAAIGEAKNVSRDSWTLNALFHSGNNVGPILQLWVRDRKGAKLMIFSTVGTECPMEGQHLVPSREELRRVIDATRELAELTQDERYTFDQVSSFLKRVFFCEWPHRTVKAYIYKWCREHDVPLVSGGIERAIALFQDETYYARKRIQRSEIINALSTVDIPIVKPSREYYTHILVAFVTSNCFGQVRHRLDDILDLYKREIAAPWRDSSRDANEVVIGILRERIESLKDRQERCGNEEIGKLIAILEKDPQLLFKESKQGEGVRTMIRRIIAEYTRLESDPLYSRIGDQL